MAFDYSKLRGKIREKFKTQDAFAMAAGLSRTALSQKLNGHVEFTQDEMYNACKILEVSLKNLDDYFFKEKVHKTEL